MYKCHNCGKVLEEIEDIRAKVGRQDTCPHCYADLHCCMNCRFHDPGYSNECRETSSPSSAGLYSNAAQKFCLSRSRMKAVEVSRHSLV